MSAMTNLNDDRLLSAAELSDLKTDVLPIRRRKLGQEVLDRLLSKIQSGNFQPGAHLPSERELMKLYSVGRPAVREALQGLERMGLVSIVHGERARVLPLSAESVVTQMSDIAIHLLSSSRGLLEHLKEARLLFETGMVRIAAERATDADIDILRRVLETQRASMAHPVKFLQADVAFHRAIVAISRNPVHQAAGQGMFEWIAKFYVNQVQLHGTEEAAVAEHESIIKCIAARDADAAAKAMAAHLTRTTNLYRRVAPVGK
jgi:GntR family transcriptional regulator, sialic acid-inducible nan operon repressor